MDIRPEKKNIVQDVIPSKRSIRNVELPSRRINTEVVPPKSNKTKKVEKEGVQRNKEGGGSQNNLKNIGISSYTYEYDDLPKKHSKRVLYISFFVLFIVLIFGILSLFKSAKVVITPQSEKVTLGQNFTAKKNDTGSSLGFQVVTLSKDLDKTVTATGEQKVSKKAQGKIVIYNNYSTQPQKLVATTRFQTPEGLIFRLVEATTVPGKKTVAGSVEVLVVADESGEKYNVGLKDFTIPGFKGTPKYSQIYARSKTPLAGGFVGVQKVVSEEVLSQTGTELEAKLKDYLSREIVSQIPADFVLYSSGLSYNFGPTTQVSNSTTDSTIIRKKGTANAIVFDKGSLSRAITGKALPNVVDELVKITNLQDLDFSYQQNTSFDINSSTSLSFTLKGEANFVWIVDENKLKSDILGLSKTEAMNLIGKNKSIKEAWIETKPFWNTTIPEDSKKVTLVNSLEK